MDLQLEQEEPILVLKPSILNALVPTILKTVFYLIILGSLFFGVFWLMQELNIFNNGYFQKYTLVFAFIAFLLIIPVLVKLLLLYNTHYVFYNKHVVVEFELFFVRRHSTPYHQIVNITSKISLWDRFCKAGDVTLHTAEDRLPDLVLHYIKEPEKVESILYKLINKFKTNQ